MLNLSVISSIAPIYMACRTAELQKVLRTSATLATVVALPALLVLLLMPQQVTGLVFGPKFSPSRRSTDRRRDMPYAMQFDGTRHRDETQANTK